MEIGLRDRAIIVGTGELFVVPKGVEHITRAARECHALIIEPRGMVNTGGAGGPLTAANEVWVQGARHLTSITCHLTPAPGALRDIHEPFPCLHTTAAARTIACYAEAVGGSDEGRLRTRFRGEHSP